MDMLEFEHLCRDASVQLGVADTGALGRGVGTHIGDVLFEACLREHGAGFGLVAQVGGVSPHDRVAVYERLLTIQLMTWNRPHLRFGFDAHRRCVVLCVEARIGTHTTADWLAMLVRSIARQAVEWRHTLLSGQPVELACIDDDQPLAWSQGRTADILAQRT